MGKDKKRKYPAGANFPPAAGRKHRRATGLQRLWLVLFGLSLFAGLELILRVALPSAGPVEASDPFLGFSAVHPLFESYRAADGSLWMKTASGKLRWFNRQDFPLEKPAGAFRIFSLGGSTTYGRPYLDATSFSGWLRKLLALADSSRRYEVINAGGISYASYREAIILQEVLRYNPDLIIICTGHNEFLEARTYGEFLERISPVFEAHEAFSRLRTYQLLSGLYRSIGNKSGEEAAGPGGQGGSVLGAEVQTILDRSAGLDYYNRDTTFSRKVFDHFRFNLDRIKKLCRDADVPVVFLDPADNLKDFSPFKSQENAELDSRGREKVQATLADGIRLIGEGRVQEAVERFRQAAALDTLYAQSYFFLGSAQLAAGDTAAAAVNLLLARELDVCPLRPQEPIHQILREATAGSGDPDLLDIPGLFRSLSPGGLIGREQLIDHIHPYPDGYLRIALEILAWMQDKGYVKSGSFPDDTRVAEVYERVMSSLPPEYFRKGVINLAKVLIWARKFSEALAVLQGHWELVESESEAQYLVGSALQQSGAPEAALKFLRMARDKQPGHLMVLDRLAQVYSALDMPDSAAATYEQLIQLYPDKAAILADYAALLSLSGQTDRALEMFQRAQNVDPSIPGINNDLGLLYSMRQEYGRAVEVFRRQLELTPNDQVTWFNLGIAYSLNGEPEDAEKCFQQTLQLNPDNVGAHINLGNLYQNSGRTGQAEEQFRLALVLDPSQLAAYLNLARLYKSTGRDSLCAEIARRGLILFPGNASLEALSQGSNSIER